MTSAKEKHHFEIFRVLSQILSESSPGFYNSLYWSIVPGSNLYFEDSYAVDSKHVRLLFVFDENANMNTVHLNNTEKQENPKKLPVYLPR